MARSSAIFATCRDRSSGRTIVGMSTVSVRPVARSLGEASVDHGARASGLQSRLVAISTSAAISDRASPQSPRARSG